MTDKNRFEPLADIDVDSAVFQVGIHHYAFGPPRAGFRVAGGAVEVTVEEIARMIAPADWELRDGLNRLPNPDAADEGRRRRKMRTRDELVAPSLATARTILARLSPAQEGAEPATWPERQKDLAWLDRQKRDGHCGESTSEAIQRVRVNECVDRIKRRLYLSPQPQGGGEHSARVIADYLRERDEALGVVEADDGERAETARIILEKLELSTRPPPAEIGSTVEEIARLTVLGDGMANGIDVLGEVLAVYRPFALGADGSYLPQWSMAVCKQIGHDLHAILSRLSTGGAGAELEARSMTDAKPLAASPTPPGEGEHVLPCDIEVGHVRFRKGVKLATFVNAAKRWHALAAEASLSRLPVVDGGEEDHRSEPNDPTASERTQGPCPAPSWEPTHRHLKRGTTYKVLGSAILQTNDVQHDGASLVLYQGEDGRFWVRPGREFEDGRFEALPDGAERVHAQTEDTPGSEPKTPISPTTPGSEEP